MRWQGWLADVSRRLRNAGAEPSVSLRSYFAEKLSGEGLELGALCRPMVTHARMKIQYVDRLTVDEQRQHYPELAGTALVTPDILDDAETLTSVADGSCDFVIAAHVIEHMKNPIAAVQNWLRVLRAGGLLYLVVPDKRHSFDRDRPCTPVDHLILDYRDPSEDRDTGHYLEWSTLVQKAQNEEDAKWQAARLRAAGYSIHFHVFDPPLAVAMLRWLGAHVSPSMILEGPAKSSADSDEFHLLVRKR